MSKVLVLIHGAGHFDENYQDWVVAQIQRRLNRPIVCLAVRYSPIIENPGRAGTLARAGGNDSTAQFQNAFQYEFAREALLRALASMGTGQLFGIISTQAAPAELKLLNDLLAQFQTPQAAQIRSSLLSELGHLFPGVPLGDWLMKLIVPRNAVDAARDLAKIDLPGIIREVALYLGNTSVREQIKAELKTRLEQATRYDEIVLVSHSLGAIIAFDVLRECADAYGSIAAWFTLGCPLQKVARIGYPTDLGKISSATVHAWFNLYDTTDIVAGPIGPLFAAARYPLYDVFVDVGLDPMGSHDYFRDSPTLDLIAREMA